MKNACIFFFFLAFNSGVYCQWSADISENNIVSWYTLNPKITTDMENGLIVVMQTHPVDPIIYAQRISVDGQRLWPGREGVRVSLNPHEQWLADYRQPEYKCVMSDGKGGCYIVFSILKLVGQTQLDPEDMYDRNLYLQRLDAQGNRLFGDEGVELMHEEMDSVEYAQEINHWFPDGEGGVYLIWFRYNSKDVGNTGRYICRISDKGEFLWGPQLLIDHPHIPYLDADKNLNLYSARQNSLDKFIKYDAKTGAVLSEKEIEISVGGIPGYIGGCEDYFPSDNFSAVFVFRDFRADSLRAQKLDENGNKLWGYSPIFIATGLADAGSFDAVSDKNGGAFIHYMSADDSMHLIHLDRMGMKDWQYSYPLTNWWLSQFNKELSIVSDGSVYLIKERGKYLAKLDIKGRLLWETQVTSRDTVASEFTYWCLLADNLGGCIVLWMESGMRFYGLRAQRITSDGKLGNETRVPMMLQQRANNSLTIESLYPNPSNSQTAIQLLLSKPERVEIKIYKLLGKEVITLHDGELGQGEHSIIWNGLDQNRQQASSGVYYLVCQTGLQKITSKLLLLR